MAPRAASSYTTTGDTARDKAGARQQASKLFPLDADQWSRAKDDGRAEAALIAWFGMKWV